MRQKLTFAFLVIFLLALLTGGGVWWLFGQLQPVDAEQTDLVSFTVEQGSGVSTIADQLQSAGLIQSSLVFNGYVRYAQIDTNLQAGTYQLSPAMSLSEIATQLTDSQEVSGRITIIEGWRREEIAAYLAQQNFPNYDEAEFLRLTTNLEGRLFPDTYQVAQQTSTEQVVTLLTTTFEQKVLQSLAEEFAASTLIEAEIITLASIVEREARDYEDMRHVSGILLNRINIGMALQADATMQYANGYDEEEETWWVTPRSVHRQIVSPYNTYQQPGLPPAPIANPGLQAFRAVLDPIPSDDLFYIHTSTGEAYYAETLEEHNANINRYLR
ncbi:MAG: endolytic transglycosylase MltG [Patescibacteria group bacterium]